MFVLKFLLSWAFYFVLLMFLSAFLGSLEAIVALLVIIVLVNSFD